ncbi:pentapeptide repeat-containing protein [Nocardioides palaemonis]|uniref:pentapeptide repeat-containing protein n=1 Tax=Nocardioides palaemonis TaxID=2829810 RepID=UPI0027DCED95|nr:pentapeptide repeat-containing protein [Nocardioides palaemonis]
MPSPELTSDCSRCFGLCCVLMPFSASSGFGVDKPSGTPCLHLAADDSCSIHATLREDGWPGCTVFECFGAGQQVSQVTYGGVSWRAQDNLGEMAAALSVMRQLHEVLVHLHEVARRSPDPDAARTVAEVEALTGATPVELLTYDLDELHLRVGGLLGAASARLRAEVDGAQDRSRADLAGHDLRGDRRGWSFRGALLMAADLREADLALADVLGADLRDADVRGADLSTALFLTQPQLNSARGDGRTQVPAHLARPRHWRT